MKPILAVPMGRVKLGWELADGVRLWSVPGVYDVNVEPVKVSDVPGCHTKSVSLRSSGNQRVRKVQRSARLARLCS